jgi:hypothetical protein
MEYTRHGRYGDVAFGGTPRQRFMGFWPDGRLIRPLDVYTPGHTVPADSPVGVPVIVR